MGRNTVLSWKQLAQGQAVHVRTGDGWRKAKVLQIYENHVTVFIEQGTKVKTQNVYDQRHVAVEFRRPTAGDTAVGQETIDLGL